jgi:hypothetical protein
VSANATLPGHYWEVMMVFQGALLRCAALAGALALSGLLPGSAMAQPANPGAGATVCQRCHEADLPLPASHPKIKGAAIGECAGCHPSQIGQTKPYAFATKLHRAHVAADLDCTGCHTVVPGKTFSAATTKDNLGAVDLADYLRLKKAVATWADSKGIAAIHGRKLNLSCGACHGKQLIPDDNETVVNKQCVTCHGDYDKMAEVSKAKLAGAQINPHSSHLGPQIACTVCHQGHVESKPYCMNCHTNFKMPIP